MRAWYEQSLSEIVQRRELFNLLSSQRFTSDWVIYETKLQRTTNLPFSPTSVVLHSSWALHHHHTNTSKYRQRNHLGRNNPRRPRRLGVWYVSRFMFLITYELMVFLHILESKQLVMTWNDPHPTQTPSFIQTGFTGVIMNRRRLPACVLSIHALPPQPPQLAATEAFQIQRVPKWELPSFGPLVRLLMFVSRLGLY